MVVAVARDDGRGCRPSTSRREMYGGITVVVEADAFEEHSAADRWSEMESGVWLGVRGTREIPAGAAAASLEEATRPMCFAARGCRAATPLPRPSIKWRRAW